MPIIKRALDAVRNPQTLEERLAQLTPEQRAQYEAAMAQSQAAAAGADDHRMLGGPAGRHLYGPTAQEQMAQLAEPGMLRGIAKMTKQALPQAPMTGGDPAVDRAARDAARAPYRASDPAPVEIHRVGTRGKTQVAEVLAQIQGARPDRIFGVYRVPDRISGPMTPGSEKSRVVEWDIVHSPGGEGTGPPLVATTFPADPQWVARRLREPSVLDEDLALAFCLAAGIGPERCAGLARVSEFRALDGGEDVAAVRTIVRGVVAIHPQDATGTYERMRAAAPLTLGSAEGVHIEVLNWALLGGAVHPKIHHPPPVPGLFPYLPATPQELLRAYLEVVGLRPEDCYSAQATVDAPRALGGHTNVGPKQPCADGKERMRSRGCEHVVFVYRDRPEYAEGRDRWGAYEAEVLQAKLRGSVRLRPPVHGDDGFAGVPGLLRPMVKAAAFLDRFDPDTWFDSTEELPPFRYCWPPVK